MTSRIRREIEEIPEAAARLAEPSAQEALAGAAALLSARDPAVLITVARGSSDHAATALKHAVEVALGLPVASVGPSVASVWSARLHVGRAAALAISQSGGSDDIVALAGALAEDAPVVALTNTRGSRLGAAATQDVDLRAGPEQAVAATKSFVNAVLAGLWIVAHWARRDDLAAALRAAPEWLAGALAERADWVAGLDRLTVIGRGPGLGHAREVALKAVETLGIPAMGESAAEILHGPSAILADGAPVLVLGAAGAGTREAEGRLAAQGARVIRASERPLPHPLIGPLDQVVTLYAAFEAEARRRGRDPDRPPFLQKATVTR